MPIFDSKRILLDHLHDCLEGRWLLNHPGIDGIFCRDVDYAVSEKTHTMSKKIPFKISARTARLIGRQNFPNPEGAIIELVKNSYDADAKMCVVVFDNQYAALPNQLTPAEYDSLLKKTVLLSKYYHFDTGKRIYVFQDTFVTDNDQEPADSEKQALSEFFQSQCKLFIIDNGEGMTDEIIEKFWMTIGTNNKEVDVYTRTGRVKTGEKGIGRFALDKLGDSAEMLTKPDPQKYSDIHSDIAFLWQVNWNDFEGDTKTLNEIEANLIDVDSVNFAQAVAEVLPLSARKNSELNIDTFSTGTRIEVSNLRDIWSDALVSKLFTNLEVLIPPREERIFEVFLFSTLAPDKYGKVSPSICDDYDYKVEARIDANGMAQITIFRNEFDVSKFPDELFNRESMQRKNFMKTDFEKREIVINRPLSQLVPGLADVDDANILENIGAFDFVFYFMKQQTTKKDREVFLYKDFNAASRKAWFDQFGGIKLFRDNFRVRPYGETNNAAFDWLQLGERASRSPSSVGQQRTDPWRVRPSQISGIINISRLTNINFEDTSSRYGLQENRTFEYFTRIITGILDVFERDRSHVGRELRAHYEATHADVVSEEKTQEVKRRVKQIKSKRRKSQVEEDVVLLSEVAERLEEQIEELKDETNLLRILASSGLITASFTHELKNIKDNLVIRVDEVKEHLQPIVDMEKCQALPYFLNPFTTLDIIKREDEKLKEWLHYSLETLRRDKRRRTDIDLLDYLEKYKLSWNIALSSRGVQLNLILPDINDLKIRVFEADLDCIFNNLLINSLEAFLKKDAPPKRSITIQLALQESDVCFIYSDSGPGLSEDIVDPERVFEPHFTTKKDYLTGEDIGTGLGMWLVKSFVNENNGSVEILKPHSGFAISIKFHNKVKRL